MDLHLGNTTAIGGGANDLVEVAGNLSLGASLTVNIDASAGNLAPAGGTYRLINYSGALSGNTSGWTVGSVNSTGSYLITFDTTTAGQVNLIATAATCTWNGSTNANWATGGNWSTGFEPQSTTDAIFPTPVPGTGSTITLSAGKDVRNMTFNDSYTLTGGSLGGAVAHTISVASTKTATFGSTITSSGALTKSGAGTLVLNAANSYGGTTVVTDGVLRISNGGALGSEFVQTLQTSGSVGGEVHLTGDITVANTLIIGGSGNSPIVSGSVGAIGALHSASGTNTWSGTIVLNGEGDNSTFDMPQISAEAGSTLVLSGVIQDGSIFCDTWAKSRGGDVVLTGASPNLYTNLTRVYFGRLIIEKDGALGTAGSPTGATGNTFQLTPSSGGGGSTIAFRAPASSPAGFSYNTAEWIITGGSGLTGGQIDNLGGNNTFAGTLGLGGFTVSSVVQSSLGVTAGSLELSGKIYASGTSARNINKVGLGTLIISGDSSTAPTNSFTFALANGTLNVNEGTLEMRGILPGVTTWNVATGATLSVTGGTFNPPAVNVAAGGQLNLSGGAIAVTSLTIDPGASAAVAEGSSVTLQASTVAVGQTLDLTDNKMVVTAMSSGTWNGSSYTGVLGLVQDGRSDGSWNGAGILTSMTDATTGVLTTLAVARADETGHDGGTFGGVSVSGDDVLVMYTWGGDADLNGELNGDDYFYLDSSVLQSGSVFGFHNGDFDYNGELNGDDYFILDSNIFQAQASSPFPTGASVNGLTSVPEPASMGLLAILGVTMRRRRPNPTVYA